MKNVGKCRPSPNTTEPHNKWQKNDLEKNDWYVTKDNDIPLSPKSNSHLSLSEWALDRFSEPPCWALNGTKKIVSVKNWGGGTKRNPIAYHQKQLPARRASNRGLDESQYNTWAGAAEGKQHTKQTEWGMRYKVRWLSGLAFAFAFAAAFPASFSATFPASFSTSFATSFSASFSTPFPASLGAPFASPFATSFAAPLSAPFATLSSGARLLASTLGTVPPFVVGASAPMATSLGLPLRPMVVIVAVVIRIPTRGVGVTKTAEKGRRENLERQSRCSLLDFSCVRAQEGKPKYGKKYQARATTPARPPT